MIPYLYVFFQSKYKERDIFTPFSKIGIKTGFFIHEMTLQNLFTLHKHQEYENNKSQIAHHRCVFF